MATKVKYFKDESLFNLREKVTEFLKEHPEIKIIASNLDYEIKYSSKSNSFISHEGSHCMILIYEEGK